MHQKSSGQNYAPEGKANAVCAKGEFPVAVAGLDHGHIYGMCNGLKEAGANIVLVYDPDPVKVNAFLDRYPEARPADSEEEIIRSANVRMVATAAVPVNRAPLGIRVMETGKDFFTDKPPCTTRVQLKSLRKTVAETGRKYAMYYSERIHVEGAVLAGQMIRKGRIGRVLQVTGLGPHRLNRDQRPAWFFDSGYCGGILVDIGCHQIEQFLYYSGAGDAEVTHSQIANYENQDKPDFQDYGDAVLVGDNGATHYFRVDWFTPDGLGSWGDGRTIILGTEGYIEIRKYLDIAREKTTDHLYIADGNGEEHIAAAGSVGFPFFGELIRDCLDGTSVAFDQKMFFKAIELAIDAQEKAVQIR